MTIDWTVDTPIPKRPAAPERRRRRPRRRRLSLALGVGMGVALVLAACDPLGDPSPAHAPVRPARTRTHTTVHPLPIRWGVDSVADPTALVVDRDEAFVVEPYAVAAIAVGDGATRWRVDVKDAEPFVAVDPTTVLVAAVDGFEALDRGTGTSRWRVEIEDPFDRGRAVGLVQTPAGSIAVATTERGGIAGIDAATGVTRWSATVDGSPRGQVTGDPRTGLVAIELDHEDRVELHVLDAATGKERWSTSLGVMTGWPLVDGGHLVLDTGDVDGRGTVIAFDLATGARAWEADVAASSEAGEGGVVDGDTVVVVDGLGTVTALDRRTGARVWSTDLPMPVFHGRPVIVDRAIVLRDITGEFQVLDRHTGAPRASFRATGVGVGLGAGPSGLVFARSRVGEHQVVGLPRGMTTMRTFGRRPRAVGTG